MLDNIEYAHTHNHVVYSTITDMARLKTMVYHVQHEFLIVLKYSCKQKFSSKMSIFLHAITFFFLLEAQT